MWNSFGDPFYHMWGGEEEGGVKGRLVSRQIVSLLPAFGGKIRMSGKRTKQCPRAHEAFFRRMLFISRRRQLVGMGSRLGQSFSLQFKKNIKHIL